MLMADYAYQEEEFYGSALILDLLDAIVGNSQIGSAYSRNWGVIWRAWKIPDSSTKGRTCGSPCKSCMNLED
jgi:hypothetical protein